MSTFCASETVKATSRIDVKRTLRIAAVDVAAGRGWAAGPRARKGMAAYR